jgi:polysaccharide export outer membrane protein
MSTGVKLAGILCAAISVIAGGRLHAAAQPPAASSKPAEIRSAGPDQASEVLSRSGREMSAGDPVDPKTYEIGLEDVLGINVWKEREFSGEFVVRPDGKITMPLIGDLQAAGMTPEQLQAKVAEALTKYLNQPQVIVSVRQVRSKRYYISGEVNNSGPVPLVTPTTVMQALSAAGLREWAKKNKIIIMRGNERLKFNYNDVVKGKKMQQNVLLQNGDHIVVP